MRLWIGLRYSLKRQHPGHLLAALSIEANASFRSSEHAKTPRLPYSLEIKGNIKYLRPDLPANIDQGSSPPVPVKENNLIYTGMIRYNRIAQWLNEPEYMSRQVFLQVDYQREGIDHISQ
jgi:hypothetical protein